jgi:hypothetical protein
VRILPPIVLLCAVPLAACSKSAPSTAPEQELARPPKNQNAPTKIAALASQTKEEPKQPTPLPKEESATGHEADKAEDAKSGGPGSGAPPREVASRRRKVAAAKATSEREQKEKNVLAAPTRTPSEAGTSYRAGALRLVAKSRSRYELAYEPGTGPRLAALAKKLGGRPAEAQVTPFQSLAADPDAEPIQRAGELVAIALALQLEQMGWRVELALREQLAAGLRVPDEKTAPASAFRVSGRVRFQTTRAEATLRGTVIFAHGAAVKRVTTEARTPVKGDRKLAAEAALRDFVARVVGAPGLDAALAALVPR